MVIAKNAFNLPFDVSHDILGLVLGLCILDLFARGSPWKGSRYMFLCFFGV